MRKYLSLLAVFVGLAAPVAASPIIYSLNDPNPAVAGFPDPFGGVVVNLINPNVALIQFFANESHPNAITFGGTDAADLNVNAGSVQVVGLGEGNSMTGFDLTVPPTVTFSGNADGLGDYNVHINNFDGFTHSATSIGFTLVNTSGTWASSNDVLTNNAFGNAVAVHAFVCASNVLICNSMSSALATGFVADGPTGKPTQFCTDPQGCDAISAVPEPASMALLGSGLAFMGQMVRRRRKQV